MSFEPKILGFLCNWCSYAGADLAGVSRFQYPTNLRVIRVMCSGRVDPLFVIKAFQTGYDGVAVLGCHLGDCHYLSGNYETQLKIKALSRLLSFINFDKRLILEWVSASEGLRFSQVITDFTEQIKNLGPSPLRGKDKDPILFEELQAIGRVAEEFRVRTLVTRQRTLEEQGNVYGDKLEPGKLDKMIDDALNSEYIRSRIYYLLKKEPKSVKDLSNILNVDPQDILKHVVVLKQRGDIALDRIEDVTPLYTVIEV
ncbi:MAG: hydrogenase iron-sulfur subunit [Candidatus Helarchaeota archaeon]